MISSWTDQSGRQLILEDDGQLLVMDNGKSKSRIIRNRTTGVDALMYAAANDFELVPGNEPPTQFMPQGGTMSGPEPPYRGRVCTEKERLWVLINKEGHSEEEAINTAAQELPDVADDAWMRYADYVMGRKGSTLSAAHQKSRGARSASSLPADDPTKEVRKLQDELERNILAQLKAIDKAISAQQAIIKKAQDQIAIYENVDRPKVKKLAEAYGIDVG
jgi:hypothetical protein